MLVYTVMYMGLLFLYLFLYHVTILILFDLFNLRNF